MGYIATTELFATAERLLALERDLGALQPRLALRPVKLANQTLVVTAASAGVAARLRQFEPSLLAGLRAKGWLVNKVRFRAATRFDGPPVITPRQKDEVGEGALESLERFVAEQAVGDPLAAVMGEFIARQRGYARRRRREP